ncbi:MAG TPA: acyl-CoA dehydrogenase family protein [Candidatus Limnocylindria bacterium]
MSDTALVEQLATDVFERHCSAEVVTAAEGGWSAELWRALEETGLTRVGVSEESGGAGGGWPEAAAVLRLAARYAAPVPLAETTVLAAWTADAARLEVPAGPLTVAFSGLAVERRGTGWVLRGRASRVPWASEAAAIVALAPSGDARVIAAVPPALCRIERGWNVAREPRDTVTLDGLDLARVPWVETEPTDLRARGALARSIQIAGALDRVLALTTEYVRVRRQFGRALADFQAVQQELALLAGEVAAADGAAQGAVSAAAAIDGPPARAVERCGTDVAVAKIRTGMAATGGARIAHQLHGAIGVTYEHRLHHFTSRLWSWRDEFGGEREWAMRLGRVLAATGGLGTWERLTASREEAVA